MRVVTAVIVALLPGLAGAQDEPADFMIRDRPPGTARLLGLGGAFVGLGDDVNALTANPAALPTLPRTLDSAVQVGTSWTTFVGGASQLHRQFSVGAILWAQNPRASLDPVRGGFDVERAKLSGPGLAVGWRPRMSSGRFSLGASYVRAGLSARDSPIAGEDGANVWCFGAFFRPSEADAPRMGLTFRPATDWRLETGEGQSVVVRKPGVVSAGAAWSYGLLENTRMLMTIQSDLVRYSGITPPAGSPRPHDDLDLRVGLEAWIPWGCITGCGDLLQLRLAVVSRAPVPFVPGLGVDQRTSQGPSRKQYLAGGVSMALQRIWLGQMFEARGRFRFDVGYDHETRAWLFGLAFRYPQAFRGELQHHRRPKE